MTPPAIELTHLTKRYRTQAAVDDFSLTVGAGQLYGFLGPNGAGKTTTIRLILNLMRPTSGEICVFGAPITRHGSSTRKALHRVGAFVEGTSFYPYLSAEDNLRVLCQVRGAPEDRINLLLTLVGLKDRGGDRFSSYSTGMRARLGLAAALIHDPDLLVLDEPASGLDPQGMAELRYLLRYFVESEGKTVFLSSHQLSEIEQTCDRVAILNKGRLIAEGTVSELISGRELAVRFTVNDATRALKALPSGYEASQIDAEHIEVRTRRESIPTLVNTLVRFNVSIFGVAPAHASLESLFLELTASSDADGAPDVQRSRL